MTVKSGYLNNPPKVIIIGDDNKAGSYPGLSSPRDISASPDTNRPYRDHVVPAIHSPYASARVRFLSSLPAVNSTITLTSSSGKVSTFTFKYRSPLSLSAPLGDYDVNLYLITLASEPFDNLEAAVFSSQKFVETVSKVPECQITAELGSLPGEVILRQAIPGTAGNTSISTTVLSTRASVENFSGGSSVEVRYPYGVALSDTDSQTSEIIRRFIKSERSGTLSAPGDADPMRFTAPADHHPYTLYRPYDESHSQQSFGVPGGSDTYGTQTEIYSDFFARGSTLGPLDEPLWVKDKIEIDLTPVETTSIWHYSWFSNPLGVPNHHMMYYNFSEQKWDRLGFGDPYNNPGPTFQEWLDRHYIGFSQNCNNESNLNPDDATYAIDIYDPQLKSNYERIIGEGVGAESKRAFIGSGYASPIDTFGFPFHPKYHATSSQTLDVTSLVDRPFLVEKIVYEFSGSAPKAGILSGAVYFPGPNLNRTFISPSATFFILNQRKANPDPGQENSFTNTYIAANSGFTEVYLPPKDQTDFKVIRYENGGIPQSRVLSPSAPATYVDTVRDLVTFARVGAVWPTYKEEVVDTLIPGFPHPAEFMDLAIEVPVSGTFDGIYTLAADVKTPSNNPAVSVHIVQQGTSSITGFINIYTAKDTSTRNSADIPTGRSLRGDFNAAEIDYKITNKTGAVGSRTATYGVRRDAEASPYLIMPGDKLIFGWQSSFTNNSRDITNPSATDGNPTQNRAYGFPLVIGPGAGKLVLYGSYLRDNKPVHDIYKDQLISDSVHEAIPAGPAVLDMFDTEPTMVFSGSMREEFVTGTMFETSGRTITGVTDPNDLTSVRMVTARASDGNLGRRASFFRNYRIASEGEQFYDSMQPNPISTLIDYGDGDGRAIVAEIPNKAFALLMLPGENYFDGGLYDSDINSIANKNFIGSFPFEPKYSQINRVKSINSTIVNFKKLSAFDVTTGVTYLLSISGIMFATGSYAGDGSKSNLVLPGGLMSGYQSLLLSSRLIVPEVSVLDTNPIKYSANPVWFAESKVDINRINYPLSRFMGCFGNGILGLIQYQNITIDVDPEVPSPSLMIYRGCKYGLINPTPLQSSAVYVGTRFGQFRDMLEQRPLSVFQSGEEADYRGLSLTGYGSRSSLFPSPSSEIPQYPVLVKFIDRSTGAALPEGNYSGTNSINLSPYCTSSLPYFDGEVKDRGLPLPEQSIYYTPVFPSI